MSQFQLNRLAQPWAALVGFTTEGGNMFSSAENDQASTDTCNGYSYGYCKSVAVSDMNPYSIIS